MGTSRKTYKVAAILFPLLLGSTPVMATELSPLQFQARYRVAWSGITLGRIRITATEDSAHYSMAIDTKTSGAGALVSGDRSLIRTHGRIQDNFIYIPAYYESKPLDGSDRTVVQLTYDTQGHLTNRLRQPDDDPKWRPPVPVEEINSATDPVTAAFLLRRKLHAAIATNTTELSTRTYDGARLATMKITPVASEHIEIMGHTQAVMKVGIQRIPLNGYTPKEWKKYKKGDPAIHLYFSDDSNFLPVRASANTGFGELSMTMVERQ